MVLVQEKKLFGSVHAPLGELHHTNNQKLKEKKKILLSWTLKEQLGKVYEKKQEFCSFIAQLIK